MGKPVSLSSRNREFESWRVIDFFLWQILLYVNGLCCSELYVEAPEPIADEYRTLLALKIESKTGGEEKERSPCPRTIQKVD